MSLIHEPNIHDPDSFYEELVGAQRDLTDAEAEMLLAKLVLILANHIGDRGVLSEAIRMASTRASGAAMIPGYAL